MKKKKVCIWVFHLVRLSHSQNREKNVRFHETYPRVILSSIFEMDIDDVVGMTHPKKISQKKVWIMNFILELREINSDLSVPFPGHFLKSTEFYQNFKTRTVSLNQNWFCWSRTVIFPGKPSKVLIKVYLNWLWSILKINTRCHFLESRPYKLDVTKTKYIKLMKIWNFSMRFYAEMNQNKWALQNEIILKILSIRKMYEFSQSVSSEPILNVDLVRKKKNNP